MPDTVQEWAAEDVIFGAFLMILQAFWPPKPAKSGLKHAPQRRGYTRSLPMGPIDGTHGCPQKTLDSKMQEIMPDTVQEWAAEEVTAEAFWIRSLTVGIRRCGKSPPWVAQVVVEQYIGMACAPLEQQEMQEIMPDTVQ
eukprot:gene10252-biopygen1747